MNNRKYLPEVHRRKETETKNLGQTQTGLHKHKEDGRLEWSKKDTLLQTEGWNFILRRLWLAELPRDK